MNKLNIGKIHFSTNFSGQVDVQTDRHSWWKSKKKANWMNGIQGGGYSWFNIISSGDNYANSFSSPKGK